MDNGIDQIRVYDFQKGEGKLELVEIIRSPLESAPRSMRFSNDSQFCYILHEQSCMVSVYRYQLVKGRPEFELLQSVPTQIKKDSNAAFSASFALRLTEDGEYAFTTTAGDNIVTIFKIDKTTGLLELLTALPISGEHPKGIAVYPDGSRFVVANHDSNELRTFDVCYTEKRFVGKGRPTSIISPNCPVMLQLEE